MLKQPKLTQRGRVERMPTQVAIVDDHPLIRRGVAAALNEEADLETLWTADSIAEAWRHFQTGVPDLVVVDLVLADGNGLELTKRMKAESPSTKVLVSSMRDERIYSARCMRAGASGFISKSRPVEELIQSIRLILDGRTLFSSNTAGPTATDQDGPLVGIDRLSDRELRVLELIGSGLDTRQIAEVMSVSRKTVDSFRERIKQKLGVATAQELSHLATSWMITCG